MADLRATFESAGGKNVVTYIQSGNVVFDHPSRSAAQLAVRLGSAVAKASGFDVEIVVRTACELDTVIAESPFAGAAPENMHVMFLAERVTSAALASIEPAAFAPDRFVIAKRELYLSTPNGLGNSKLAATLLRHKALRGATYRNWKTVLALAALTAQG